MQWKERLYTYVNQRNQMAMDYDISHIASYVSDPVYLEAAQRRLDRLKALNLKRDAAPVKYETKLKLIHVHENEAEATVAITLLQSYEYRLKQQHYYAKMREYEQIVIAPAQGNCMIRRILPDLSERDTLKPESYKTTRLLASPPYLNQQLLAKREAERAAVLYERNLACSYADRWWDSHNPQYEFFAQDDCTNFVSQCLFAGRMPMHYTGKRETGWWYRGLSGKQEQWSFSWAVADSLRRYLSTNPISMHAESADQPNKLSIGDVISYDWDGNGHYEHSAIVTEIDANGMPLVNAHTTDSRHRYWDYRDSYAWTEQTKYRFIHMPDQF
jgi:hypothetical protein